MSIMSIEKDTMEAFIRINFKCLMADYGFEEVVFSKDEEGNQILFIFYEKDNYKIKFVFTFKDYTSFEIDELISEMMRG